MVASAFPPPPVVFDVPLPDPTAVSRFLSDLTGRDVTVVKQEPALKPAESFAARIYLHGGTPGQQHPGDGQPAVLLILDRAAAAYLGAALSLVPKGAADESAKGPPWMDSLTDNITEVLNVMTGLFNKGAVRHAVPGHMLVKVPLRPEDVVFANLARVKLSVKVSVAGYGAGRMTFFS